MKCSVPPKNRQSIAPIDFCNMSAEEKCQMTKALDLGCLTPQQLQALAGMLAPYMAGAGACGGPTITYGCAEVAGIQTPAYQVCSADGVCNHYDLSGAALGPSTPFSSDCEFIVSEVVGPLCVTEGMASIAQVKQVTWRDLANPAAAPEIRYYDLSTGEPFVITDEMTVGACAGTPSLAVPGCLFDVVTSTGRDVFQIRPFIDGVYSVDDATYALLADGTPTDPMPNEEFQLGSCTSSTDGDCITAVPCVTC